MKTALILTLGFAATALAAGTLKLTVNNRPGADAIVVNGKTYIPLEVLVAAGVKFTRSSTGLSLTLPGFSSVSAGGANQRASLEGCLGEALFNGVWRVKASKLTAIKKDDGTPGWGLTVELRNGAPATITPVDGGFDGVGGGIQLAFNDASTINVDAMDVQKMTFASLPPGGVVTQQLKFYYPFGTAQETVKTPTKFLLEITPARVGDSTRAKGVAFTAPNPSLRVRLDCQK